MRKKILFNEIEDNVQLNPGIYEIHTNQGIALKVGIGNNIRRRLIQHRASRQSGLVLKPGGDRNKPNDVLSKKLNSCKASLLRPNNYS